MIMIRSHGFKFVAFEGGEYELQANCMPHFKCGCRHSFFQFPFKFQILEL